jgi:hypothetical protein
MDKFSECLAKAKVVGVDTPIFIYFLEGSPRYSPLAQIIFTGIEKGKWLGVTSTITLMEITIRPWQLGRETAARDTKQSWYISQTCPLWMWTGMSLVRRLNCVPNIMSLHPMHCRWPRVSLLEQRRF